MWARAERSMPSQYADNIAAIAEALPHLATKDELGTLQAAVTRLTTLVETEGLRCPYREKIQQAANNHERLGKAEGGIKENADKISNNRVSLAKQMALGGAGGAIVALAEVLIRALS